jgi:hypothetical protein
MGLLMKDFYSLRQYAKTMIFMLVFFALISSVLTNPVTFYVGFIVFMCIMMSITSFSYDALAKWDRYALTMPVSRKDVVAEKYLLSIILCLGGAVIAFLLSLLLLYFKPVDNFPLSEHLYGTLAIVCIAFFFTGILLPLTFRFGVEKSRIFLIAVYAAPSAALIALGKAGVKMPSEAALMAFVKLLPFLMILFYFLSYLISVRIYTRKEI